MPYVSSVERIGYKRGVQEGLLEAIEMGLSIKFGEKGLRLLPAIRQIEDVERLKMIKNIVKSTDNLSEIEASLDLGESRSRLDGPVNGNRWE